LFWGKGPERGRGGGDEKADNGFEEGGEQVWYCAHCSESVVYNLEELDCLKNLLLSYVI
jgi:hypothetical protein